MQSQLTPKGMVLAMLCGAVGLIVGGVIGHFATKDSVMDDQLPSIAQPQSKEKSMTVVMNKKNNNNKPMPDEKAMMMKMTNKWEDEKELNDKLIERINSDNIRENLRILTLEPHLAATPRDVELANLIKDRFDEAGFDSAELVPQQVLLSRPNPENPNKIRIERGTEVLFESHHQEEPIHQNDQHPNFIHAFNAFTPAGSVKTDPGTGVVYVNYGRIEDFQQLKELGVNVSGHIAMVRYGKIYRGNKIDHAQQYGAVGVIIFSDPEDVAAEGTAPEDVYDNSWWLPGTGVQRGSTFTGDGDPLSPEWPSTLHSYRIKEEDAALPKIPAQPIGYTDARQILERLGGDIAPEEWQGGMDNLMYHLGPNFSAENQDLTISLETHNFNAMYESFNVIGTIIGSTEPDRYVMMGNHRDAWGYGASDPSSGTAQMLETARAFGTLLKEGWRPRRTIIFCSWGAEENGIIGSYEWVEEHVDKLQSRAVAYFNTDTCASGNILNVQASPLLWDAVYDVMKLVPSVEDTTKFNSLYEELTAYHETVNPKAEEKPVIETLGSGSDHAAFSFFAGIPAADYWFRKDERKYNITTYPSYHTGYETFYMVSTYVDPEFKIIQGCGRMLGLSLKYFADSSILPYSITRLPMEMDKGLKSFAHKDKLMTIYDKYNLLEEAVANFTAAAKEFESNLSIEGLSELQLRAMNDQLMKVEQTFIIPVGLPGRYTARHAIFAPSQFDNYASSGFPGLSDLMFAYDELTDEEKMQKDELLKRHISELTVMTVRAASLLKKVHQI